MNALSLAIAALGTAALLIASLGVLRLTDALSRQHAATKAASVAVSLVALGLMLHAIAENWGSGWVVRLVLLQVCLIGALPLASHALARAGVAESAR